MYCTGESASKFKPTFWFHLVRRCFAIIAALPVQAKLVEDVNQMAKCLAGITEQQQAIIAITKSILQ